MFEIDALNDILKPTPSHLELFFMGALTFQMNLKMEWGFFHHAIIGVIFTFFFFLKNGHNPINFICRSKVNGKSI